MIAKGFISTVFALILISEFRDIFRAQSGMRQLRRGLVWIVMCAAFASIIFDPSPIQREAIAYLEHAIEHAIIYVSH